MIMPCCKNVCLIDAAFGNIPNMKNDLDTKTGLFTESFYGTSDLIIRELKTGSVNAKLVFLDAMVDTKQLELSILRPIMDYRGESGLTLDALKGIVTSGCTMKEADDADKAVQAVSAGDAALLSEDSEKIILFGIRKGNVRAIAEPPTSQVIKGPREGFVEDLKTNMVLLRRRIRSNKLIFETVTIGRFTETTVALAYVKGVVKDGILKKIRERLEAIDTDGILDSSAVGKILEPRPYSVFKQMGNTEKPDVAAAKILDGRVAVFVDGSPIVLTIPFLLIEDFQVIQDFYNRNSRVTFLRLMRIFAVFFALLLPAAYVAVQIHQYQMLPLQLLITLLNASSGIPFTPAIEMIIALIFFEVLGEASIRMPRHVGMALSVVGAIVLGDTAVQAGLLSSVTVLVVAISGIGIYTVPDEVGVVSVLRMFLVIVGGLFGIFGILTAMIVIVVYLSTFDCYDVPYLAPFAPIEDETLRQSIVMHNFTDKKHRSESLKLRNKTRLKNDLPRNA